MNKNVFLITLGCAKNLVDSEYLVTGLKHVGYTISDDIDSSRSYAYKNNDNLLKFEVSHDNLIKKMGY